MTQYYFRDFPFSSSNQLSTTINLSGVLQQLTWSSGNGGRRALERTRLSLRLTPNPEPRPEHDYCAGAARARILRRRCAARINLHRDDLAAGDEVVDVTRL